jgi:hypothetical protein
VEPLKEHFAQLQSEYPKAELVNLVGGSSLVKIPSVVLPEGWSQKEATVIFIAPNGYPHAQPDCFWSDPELRLKNNAVPQGTGQNPCPDGQSHMWFSWHVGSWNPNLDTLLTYLRVIKRRFADAR